MGLFSKNKQQPDIEERTSHNLSYGGLSITSFFSNADLITEEEAMKIPTVTSSIELITSAIAQLPIYLYKENDNQEVERVEDRRVFLLNQEPNDLINGYNFKKKLVKDYLFHGASYTKVEKVRNDVTALYGLPIKEVTVTKYLEMGYKHTAEINLVYGASNTIQKFKPEELIIALKDSNDGVTASGVLVNNAETFRLAIDEQDYSIGILKNGALPIGVLKATSRLTENAINRLRTSFENLYGGAKKSGKTLILEEGLDYQPISMKPNEMDLTNSKKSTVSEIARIFNIPESMINSAANKYASNEQNNIYFLQYCISPIITSIETALDKALLLEDEKQNGLYFRFDTSEILRTTEKEKIETTVRGMEKGLYSINEARAKVDLPRLKDDYFTWSLGAIFYDPITGLMTIPNMGTSLDPKNPKPPVDPEAPTDEKVEDESEDQSTKEEKEEE